VSLSYWEGNELCGSEAHRSRYIPSSDDDVVKQKRRDWVGEIFQVGQPVNCQPTDFRNSCQGHFPGRGCKVTGQDDITHERRSSNAATEELNRFNFGLLHFATLYLI
jgi:hypothetical protein